MSNENNLPPSGGRFLERIIREHGETTGNTIPPHTARITHEMVRPSALIYHNSEWIATERWAIRKHYVRRKSGCSILGQVTRFVDLPITQGMEESAFWPVLSGSVRPRDISRAHCTQWVSEGTLTADAPAQRLYEDFMTRHIYFLNAACVALRAFRLIVLQTSEQDCISLVVNTDEVIGMMIGRYHRVPVRELPPGISTPLDLTKDETTNKSVEQ